MKGIQHIKNGVSNDNIEYINTIPKKKRISYHVFTDNKDDFVKTLKEANDIWRKWKKDGAKNIRIYKQTSDIPDEGDDVEEEYIRGIGDFPY